MTEPLAAAAQARHQQAAAERAVDFVTSGMVVGLGSGRTAGFALERVGALLREGVLRELLGVPTSATIEAEARRLGIPIAAPDWEGPIDLTIDGADEVDPALDLIKGGGGALLREKIVAQASRREIIVVDQTKLSPLLGSRRAVPVEVLPFGWRQQARYLESLGAPVSLRSRPSGGPFLSDQGNLILDCAFGPIPQPAELAVELGSRAGIFAHGLFLGLATDLIVGGDAGITHRFELEPGQARTAIEISQEPATLARAVAHHVVACARTAIAARGRCLLALAGGSTPRAAYALLASPEFAHQIDWARVHVLWGDERCVPPDDPRSNYRMAREALLDRVPIPSGNIHRIQGEAEPSAVAARYELLLRALLGSSGPDALPSAGPDLVLLGLGDDGHTASLFPGSAAVHERVRWVAADFIDAVGTWRVTLTPVIINAVHNVSFVVSGTSKAERLHEVLEGPRLPERLPAQVIEPTCGHLTWFVDELAAALLHRSRRIG